MKTSSYFFLGISLIFTAELSAQQLPQYSQYMQNMYVVNPAASSLYEDIDLNLGFRQQWAGFDGAPQTYYLSGTVNLGKKPVPTGTRYSLPISNKSLINIDQTFDRKPKHVVGGLLARDEYGLFDRTSFMASYAYHHPIGDAYYVAAGASLGWYGLAFGADQVVLENPSDNTYNDFIKNGTRSNLFDLNAGLYLYSKRAFLGYSIYQIAQNEIDLGNEASSENFSEAKLAIHHFATVGYAFPISENLDLTPSLFFKILGPAPVSFDINLRADLYKRFWLGASFRNQDAVSIMAGLHINDWIKLGYSYDYVTSQINDLSSGSHEIVLGFQFNRKN